jgi:hypothetical protein
VIALVVRLALMVRVLRVRLLFATIQRVTVRLELEQLADRMDRNAAAAAGAGAHGAAGDLRRHADTIREIAGGRS